MERDAAKIRTGGPTIFAQVKFGQGLEEIKKEILHAYQHATDTPHTHDHDEGNSQEQENHEDTLESNKKKQKLTNSSTTATTKEE